MQTIIGDLAGSTAISGSVALADFLKEAARKYCWDRSPDDAVDTTRVVLRTMDIGTWEDLLEMERLAKHDLLVAALRSAPMGAMTPRSWSFWHHRLGLVAPDNVAPPQPARMPR